MRNVAASLIIGTLAIVRGMAAEQPSPAVIRIRSRSRLRRGRPVACRRDDGILAQAVDR